MNEYPRLKKGDGNIEEPVQIRRPSETVIEKLTRIVDNWNQIPIRVYQDGKWQSLFFTEIEDEAQIARAVISWLKPYLETEGPFLACPKCGSIDFEQEITAWEPIRAKKKLGLVRIQVRDIETFHWDVTIRCTGCDSKYTYRYNQERSECILVRLGEVKLE